MNLVATMRRVPYAYNFGPDPLRALTVMMPKDDSEVRRVMFEISNVVSVKLNGSSNCLCLDDSSHVKLEYEPQQDMGPQIETTRLC